MKMNNRAHNFLNNINLARVADIFDESVTYSRDKILNTIQSVMKKQQIKLENRESVESTLETCSNTKESFSECLNESVSKTYYHREKPEQKTNFLELMLIRLLSKHQPSEAKIRSVAPSNLPIRF